MKFHDSIVEQLDVNSAESIQELIQVHLCGRSSVTSLDERDQALLREFVSKAAPAGVTFEQFNELLLVLHQNRISRAFFDYFLATGNEKNKQVTMAMLKNGVVHFKGVAMICFGNFRFAFQCLSSIEGGDELLRELGPCSRLPEDIIRAFHERPEKVLDISTIPRDHTWFVGEITGNLVSDEVKSFEKFRQSNPTAAAESDAVAFARLLEEMSDHFVKTQGVALRNTDVYLTWDYLDVYVATSMRNKWEFEEVFDLTGELFKHSLLAQKKLRYFDPTQSKCKTSRDKGLLEGLMLKRARCTIYMAQEGDTLGKDSELAITLAQGKPVIAYVPQHDPQKFADIISKRPLKYAALRLLAHWASGTAAKIEGMHDLARQFLAEYDVHRKKQPFELWTTRDDDLFKSRSEMWTKICQLLALAEAKAFDSRAEVLRKYHPLGIQMDLRTGVANGVLVVRNLEKCAELLCAILTNSAEFDIRVDTGCRSLVENISESVFRLVTDNEKLTNSFWNFWSAQDLPT